ncbi:MAG: glycosyltransferase [Hyphomicrobiaceae bacterium]
MRPKICLNMIVKNEAHVIRRCLGSVGPIVDTWVIVDTGSTDGTPGIIQEHLKGIPGTLIERPWKNFGHNRTEALALARNSADYVLIFDADDVLVVPRDFTMPELTLDAYMLSIQLGSTSYWRTCVVSNRRAWRYVGVLHEYLACDGEYSPERLTGLTIDAGVEGGRSRHVGAAEKYANDARILEGALVDEPDNARYVFYLAQSYRDSGQWRKSLETYRRRATMGGWDEEVWYSLLEIGKLSERLELPPATVTERYLAAYQHRPRRAEPLVELARYYRERKQYALAHLFAQRAINIPMPDDNLFLDVATYRWRAIDEFAVASYWIGDYQRGQRACEKLLEDAVLPVDQMARVTENLNYCREALRKAGKSENAVSLLGT